MQRVWPSTTREVLCKRLRHRRGTAPLHQCRHREASTPRNYPAATVSTAACGWPHLHHPQHRHRHHRHHRHCHHHHYRDLPQTVAHDHTCHHHHTLSTRLASNLGPARWPHRGEPWCHRSHCAARDAHASQPQPRILPQHPLLSSLCNAARLRWQAVASGDEQLQLEGTWARQPVTTPLPPATRSAAPEPPSLRGMVAASAQVACQVTAGVLYSSCARGQRRMPHQPRHPPPTT